MLYEYRCRCGHEFETFRPVDQRRTARCPKCGRLASKKLSVVHSTFGWRLTDSSHIRGNPDSIERDI
jgi:putative FmdB family regulatory protein